MREQVIVALGVSQAPQVLDGIGAPGDHAAQPGMPVQQFGQLAHAVPGFSVVGKGILVERIDQQHEPVVPEGRLQQSPQALIIERRRHSPFWAGRQCFIEFIAQPFHQQRQVAITWLLRKKVIHIGWQILRLDEDREVSRGLVPQELRLAEGGGLANTPLDGQAEASEGGVAQHRRPVFDQMPARGRFARCRFGCRTTGLWLFGGCLRCPVSPET